MHKFCKVIDTAETVFCCACLSICMVVLFGNAIARQLSVPIRFANDIALACFAYIAFVGTDLAYRHNKLARVEFLANCLPPRGRKALECAILLINLALFLLLVFLGVQLMIRSWTRPIPSLPNVSYGWIIASVPIGSMLMAVTTVVKLYDAVKGTAPGKKEE